MGEPFHGFGQRMPGRTEGKAIVHDIPRDDELGQFGRIEITLNIVQRNGADESAVIGHIKIIQGSRDKFFSDLAKTRIGLDRERIALDQIAYMELRQLFPVIAGAFAPQRFGIDGAFLDSD